MSLWALSTPGGGEEGVVTSLKWTSRVGALNTHSFPSEAPGGAGMWVTSLLGRATQGGDGTAAGAQRHGGDAFLLKPMVSGAFMPASALRSVNLFLEILVSLMAAGLR